MPVHLTEFGAIHLPALEGRLIIREGKTVVTVFFLECGYSAVPTKKFLNAWAQCIMAVCGAFLVTSSIHGNWSRLIAFS